MEETKTQPGGRRLVLGFDAGCMTCSELAKRIKGSVGDKLEIRSLSDPQVAHWRREAFGEDALWVPTLIELDGGPVRAWTGMRMRVRLSQVLGPVATWRVIQTLGELRNESTGADTQQKILASTLSRGRFLKGASGAMLAFGLFSGITLPALADTKKKAAETGKQAERAIFLMERHMRIESNGTLSLDEKGLKEDTQAGLGEGIDRSVFAALKQNLAETNAKLLKGASSHFSGAKAENLFPTVSLQATEKSLISSKGCRGVNRVQYFWWGRRSWIDNCSTNKLVRRLFANAGVFAVIACFPVGGVPVAMASAIIALGGGAIDATNRGRGVYINYILRLVAVRVMPQ